MGGDASRMNSGYSRIPREIAIVQCEDVGHSVNQHGGYEAGIVHLRTRYRVPDDKATPFIMTQHGASKRLNCPCPPR
jgi:hypothetical protein